MLDIRTAKGQLQKRTCDCQGTHSTPCACSSDLGAAELRRHSSCVEQGVTNSHKLVIGHDCQHGHFWNHKCTVKENCAMHPLKELSLSSTTKISRSLGINTLEEQISQEDRWLGKKYTGVWCLRLILMTTVMPRFPTRVTV